MRYLFNILLVVLAAQGYAQEFHVATGGDDPMVPAQQVADFVNEMSVAKVDLELLSFPGVVHGFTNPGATEKGKSYDMPLAYDAEADQRSWKALMRFLAR